MTGLEKGIFKITILVSIILYFNIISLLVLWGHQIMYPNSDHLSVFPTSSLQCPQQEQFFKKLQTNQQTSPTPLSFLSLHFFWISCSHPESRRSCTIPQDQSLHAFQLVIDGVDAWVAAELVSLGYLGHLTQARGGNSSPTLLPSRTAFQRLW